MSARKVELIGVPMDLGGGLRGVDMGPSAFRYAGVAGELARLGIPFEDLGNVPVPRPEAREARDKSARFLPEITRCCQRLRARVERVLDDEALPLVVGGDHSIACGTVAGISSWYHRRQERIGLIWFDAHADMNTPETSLSGNVHGMPLAACLGFGPDELVMLGDRAPMVDPAHTVLIGIHDVDAKEREIVQRSGLRAFTMSEVDRLGMHRVMEEAIAIATRDTAGFHVSFDVDGCDPTFAPGVGTPVPGGATLREAHLLMEHVADSRKLVGLELTEINPILDHANRTAELAVELALSALGKRIL